MKYPKTSFILFFILLGLAYFSSCSKDDSLKALSLELEKGDKDASVMTESRFEKDDSDKERLTILGVKRNNPFSLTNINQAKAKLYGASAPDKIATHQYIKFSPTILDHLAILEDWEMEKEIAIFDFPMEYEVVVQGEHYIDPTVSDSLFTYRYAAVPTGTDLPQVPHELLEELYLDKSDPLLLAESFWLTDNRTEINEYVFHGGLSKEQIDNYAGIIPPGTIPEKPDEPCPYGYVWELVIVANPVSEDGRFVWECHLLGPPPPPPTNACNCLLTNSKRRPAGCVRVDDDGVMNPVQAAFVKLKDSWFTSDVTYTTEKGCWWINEGYSDNVWMWIHFKNPMVKAKDVNYWFSLVALRDYVGKFTAPPYNNITVNYLNDLNNNNSKARKYWAAAHTLNTVSNYRKAIDIDGIPLPKMGLNWINAAGDGGAAAPMLQGQVYNTWIAFLMVHEFPVLYYPTIPFLPDIVNQYATYESAGEFNGVGFHELGHASHYKLVGEAYWVGYRNHIVANSGYGSFGNFIGNCCPERVALGEAIGHFIGATYGQTSTGRENLEWDYDDNFIPQGLMWDLRDTINDLVSDPNDPSINGIDNISGFTGEMIFNGLTPNIYSIRAFRDRLRTLHLSDTPNSASDYNKFVDIYDVFN